MKAPTSSPSVPRFLTTSGPRSNCSRGVVGRAQDRRRMHRLAARLPLEVLDRVGHVDVTPIEARRRQRLVEEAVEVAAGAAGGLRA
jgi:hypothetical protein